MIGGPNLAFIKDIPHLGFVWSFLGPVGFYILRVAGLELQDARTVGQNSKGFALNAVIKVAGNCRHSLAFSW